MPQADLAILDPHTTPAYVTRNHGYMVYDTLYGLDADYKPSPQMLEGHTVEDDGKRWRLRLRDGLLWHDGEKVLARDCVASIKRWSRRSIAPRLQICSAGSRYSGTCGRRSGRRGR